MKYFKFIIFINIILISSTQLFAEEYKPVVKEDTSIWHVAHQQLAGNLMDTLFAMEKEGNWINIYAHGQYYFEDSTYSGKVQESSLHDKIWYVPPEETDSILVYDITLEKGDTFMLQGYPGQVDTVYFKNNRKHIEFNVHTYWGDSIQFIEGIGPNVSFIYFYENSGIHAPYVACKFNNNAHVYAVDNPKHFDGCAFNTSGVRENSGKDIPVQIFPNPFNDYLQIKGTTDDVFVLKIIDVCGNIVIDKRLYNNTTLNTGMLVKGFYIARLINIKNKNSYNFKLIKQ